MDARGAVRRRLCRVLGIPELAEESEYGRQAFGVVVVSMSEDDV